MNNKDKYFEYSKKFGKFVYKSYDIVSLEDKFEIIYHFEIPGLAEFNPSWILNKNCNVNNTIRNLVFYLGMVELISYWKLTCAPIVEVQCGYLTEEEKMWWKKLYFNGLGEFFYTNEIIVDFDNFITINSSGKKILTNKDEKVNINNNKALIPVGGGKDSVVTMELVKKISNIEESKTFSINPRGAVIDTINVAGYDSFFIERKIDDKLLDLNKKGYLNGHTPFSAIVAFSSVLTAYINNYNYVILSNESSANESTIIGTKINHQYSKSYEFEQDFFEYEKKYLNSGVKYFSLLRPLSEYQIAWIFSKYKKYHKYFKSCNVGSKEDVWCGKCPKCLFVCLILSPFLTRKEIIEIFGTDILNDENMIEIFDKLIGNASEKPFECVGSRNEVNIAILSTIIQVEKTGERLPKLLEYYKTTEIYKDIFDNKTFGEIDVLQKEYKHFFDKENNVQKEILDMIKNILF